MTSLLQASRAVNLAKLPDQTGKVYLVTGGNVGLGYEMVKALAAKNAHVFMTSRNSEKQKRYGSATSPDHTCRKVSQGSRAFCISGQSKAYKKPILVQQSRVSLQITDVGSSKTVQLLLVTDFVVYPQGQRLKAVFVTHHYT